MRKVCVVTGSRAEYGLLYWLLKEIDADPLLELQLIVTGMHLSKDFGNTYKYIEADGFRISAKIQMDLGEDSPAAVTRSLGQAVIGFAGALEALSPDILLILGDRYEILAAAQAAMIARVPIAHLHGGETTEGLIDEAIRHSVTKMSHFHYVAAEPYARRVVQLGEDPARVFNFGAVSLDNIEKLKLLDRSELERDIGFHLGSSSFLVTYHPVTLVKESPAKAVRALLDALDHFQESQVLFTKPNADPAGHAISELIDRYVAENPRRAVSCTSLGQLRYLSAIRHCQMVIGNSSSGLIEVPAMGKPTINIGDRQKGRLRATSVIDCSETSDAIVAAIRRARSAEFQLSLSSIQSPYGSGDASRRIKDSLKSVDLDGVLLKRFRNFPVSS